MKKNGSVAERMDDAYLTRAATEYLIQQVEMATYPELKSAIHIPQIFEGGAGATEITSQMIDRRGRARVTAVPADDIPLVGLVGAGSTNKVRSIAIAYEVNFQEVRTAARTGINVDTTKALAAREFVEEESNEIAYLGGNSDDGVWLNGLFKHPQLPVVVSTVNFRDPATTPEQVSSLLNEWASLVRVITRTIDADTALMPYSLMQYLSGLMWPNTSMSVMELFRKTNPKITFVDDAPQADFAGFGDTPAMIFYRRDPAYIAHYIPQPLEQMIEHDSPYRKRVIVHQRDAGVMFRQKVCAVKVEGMWS